MKFKYNKAYAIAMFLILICFGVLLFFILFPASKSSLPSYIHSRATTRNGLIVILLAFSVRFLPEYFNRYIELNETYIYCHSFRYPNRMKALSLNLMYEKIYKIEYKNFLGIFDYMYIFEQSLDHSIAIPFGFQRHRELYSEICSRVMSKNSKVAISQKLLLLTKK